MFGERLFGITLLVLCGTAFGGDAVGQVDLTSSGANVRLAVKACAGFRSTEAAKLFTVESSDDTFWISALRINATVHSVDSVLSACLQTYGGIYYDPHDNTTFTAVTTLSAVLRAIPVDQPLFQQYMPKIALNTSGLWNDAEDAITYVATNYLQNTTGLAFQSNQDLASGGLVDFIVMRRLFVVYLPDMCIPETNDHSILTSLIQTASWWPKPIGVYGYNSMWQIFGGDLFEAETDCVNVLGQIATDHASNLAFLSNYNNANGKGVQQSSTPPPPSPLPLPLQYNSSKIYVALVYGDLDNIAYVQSIGKENMLARSKLCQSNPFPFTWTLSPSLHFFSPAVLDWYLEMAASCGDKFIMPPSGYLYSYPSMFPADVQSSYSQSMNQYATYLNTTGSIHWEWLFSWENAIKNYFPLFTNSTVNSFFLNDVPWPVPILEFWLTGETYKIINGEVVLFRNAFNWMENSSSGGLPYNSTVIAGMINELAAGSIQYVYIIQNTPFQSVSDMVSQVNRDNVELVDYQQLTQLAKQKGSAKIE